MSSVLSGRRILLTRPEGQVESLLKRLEALGAQVSHFPAINITLTPPDSADLTWVKGAHLIIFASVNAVHGLMAGPGQPADLILGTQVAAIGPSTTEALRQADLEPTIEAPPPHNSEALLSTSMLQTPRNQRIVIVRGQSGREKLAEELRRRKAVVNYLEVYRRDPPTSMLSLEEMSGGPPEAICITSVEIAENLLRCITPVERAVLLQSTLIVGNPRIANGCRRLGYTAFHGVADNPVDGAMLKALNVYFSSQPPTS